MGYFLYLCKLMKIIILYFFYIYFLGVFSVGWYICFCLNIDIWESFGKYDLLYYLFD